MMPYKHLADRNACQKRCHKADPDRPKKMRQYSNRHYRERARLIQESKNKPCMDCGKVFLACCMDFDHRDRAEKKFTIGAWGYRGNLADVMIEIAKCDIVCANCHRIRTYWKKRDEA